MSGWSRRDFLKGSAAAAALSMTEARLVAQPVAFTVMDTALRVDPSETIRTIPGDFSGLSYEAAQLADPTFFSPKNTSLVAQFRALSSQGVLRLGGSLSDFTNWWDPGVTPQRPAMTDAMAAGQSRFEWELVTPAAAAGHYAVITPKSIQNLSDFLDAIGWRLIYGLNLGSGTPERASQEAACVSRVLGKRLIAFQIGNEDDYFNRGKRPPSWDFDSYWGEYTSFVKAIRARTPEARFAGPDVANHIDWVVKYAQHVQHDAVLLSSHYYRMGPAGAPGIDAGLLLSPDPRLSSRIGALLEATKIGGIPYRVTEANSCSHGGAPGISNAYASALWAADYMLQVAKAGCVGVNLHGGGMNGMYSPIVGDAQTGCTARPITYGMRLANEFSGSTLLDTQLTAGEINITAYAGRKSGELLIALINKGNVPVNLAMGGLDQKNFKQADLLSAPSVASTTGITFRPVQGSPSSLGAYSALLMRYEEPSARP